MLSAELGSNYWILLWIAMGLAFIGAWLFIIVGCEVMDKKTKDDELFQEEQSH